MINLGGQGTVRFAVPNQKYVTVADYSSLPPSGETDTIYRVANYDGTQVDTTKYAEYAWTGSDYQLLCVNGGTGDGIFDISVYNQNSNNVPAKYSNITEALQGVPQDAQHGGMVVRFINSSNYYEIWRCVSSSWSTTESDWVSFVNSVS